MAMFQKPAIGLDISDHSIEAVFMVRRGDRLEVASYGRTTLPPGVIVDGFVERRDVASLAIRKLLADKMTPPLPKGLDRIVFALPESQVYSHIFEVPRVADDTELGRSLAIEADGYFPYHHDVMVSGYSVIAQRPDRKDIYYAAVHKDTLKSYLDLFRACGLVPEAVEGESSSIARATLLPDEAEPIMIVDVGARVTNIAIFDLSGIQFSEALETAGDAITNALSSALGITQEDADSLKRNQGLIGDFDQKALKAMQSTVDALARDIGEARDYYEKKSSRPISRIVMSGGSTLMPGLVERISEKLSTPSRTQHVERADPWSGLELDPLLEKLNLRERGVLATTAVGLALRGLGVRKFSDINLLTSGAQGHSTPVAALPSARLPTNALKRVVLAGGRHLPTWLKLAIAVTGVLAVAVGTWFVAFRLRRQPPPVSAPVPVSSAPSTVAAEVSASVGQPFSANPPIVPVTELEVEVESVITVERQGETQSGYSKGRVRIVNETSNGQTLVATTRFLSEGGVLFRLDERVFVPPRGNVSAGITADQVGAEGDVPAGRFTIPGLAPGVQSSIYGETDGPTSGGVTTVGAAFTEDDLAALRGRIGSQALASLEEAVSAKVGEDALALRDALEVTDVRFIEVPTVGQSTGSFTARAQVSAKALAISRNDASALLKGTLPDAGAGKTYVLGQIEAVYDDGDLTPRVRLSAEASLRDANP